MHIAHKHTSFEADNMTNLIMASSLKLKGGLGNSLEPTLAFDPP